jgi:hypothetical protein
MGIHAPGPSPLTKETQPVLQTLGSFKIRDDGQSQGILTLIQLKIREDGQSHVILTSTDIAKQYETMDKVKYS